MEMMQMYVLEQQDDSIILKFSKSVSDARTPGNLQQ